MSSQQLKSPLPILFAILFLGGVAPLAKADGKGEQTLTLDGEWKFTTFLGEGSNYRDISPGPADLVIDNSQTDRLEVVGNWAVKSQGERDTSCWGEDYLARFFKHGDAAAYVRFDTTPPKNGLYEHFIRYPFGHHLTTRLQINHAGGVDSRHVSQRNRCGQWISLGIYRLNVDSDSSIEWSATTPGGVAVDAVMLRPVSESEWDTAREQKTKAPLPDTDDSHWDLIPAPGHWGMLNKYSNYTGKGWYRRNFTVPDSWVDEKGKRVRLEFDAVYHVANVYLNGEHIGRHQGGFTPFEFDVTDKIVYDRPNLLAVESDNNYLVGATWNWGGIIRSVRLVRNNDVRIAYQYVHAEPNLETGDASVQIKVRVENNGPQSRQLRVRTEIEGAQPLAETARTIEVAANSVSDIDLDAKLEPADVRLWHFDTPHLYTAVTTISEAGSDLHSRRDRFGIRKVQLTPSKLLLNGEPVRLSGYNRVSDHRYWGSSEPQHVLERDVKLMKNANANFMRIMHGTQNERLLDLCDKQGIMLIEEVNVRELTNPEFTPPEYPLVRQWLREMIERDVNHPSIVGWSVGNELNDHYSYVQKMIDYVKSDLDPNRLVACVSYTGHRDQDTPTNDPLTESDIMLQNCYMESPEVVIEALHRKWPGKPLFFSEFGLGKFTDETLDGRLPGLANWNANVRGRNTFVVGASLWTYNDYRSGYAETLENENRTWGLVNVWRQKRRLYDQCRAENSPVKGIVFDRLDPARRRASVTIPVRAPEDYPSFTLRDYRLTWRFRDRAGESLQDYSLSLPTLRPGDEPWTGEIEWNTPPTEPFDLQAQLTTPTGHIRAETVVRFQAPPRPAIATAIPGDSAIRVCFEPPLGADEWCVRYTGQDGEVRTSEKTIDQQLDLLGLVNGWQYRLELIASNSQGDSPVSEPLDLAPNGDILPPIIRRAFLADDKLVVGYSGESDDQSYVLQYGKDRDRLEREVRSNVRGMMVAEAASSDPVWLRIRRIVKGRESGWSNVVLATSHAPQL